MLTVRTDGADPVRRVTVSLTVKYPFFVTPSPNTPIDFPISQLTFMHGPPLLSSSGTVHGALDSGRREAERILKWIRNPAPHFD